MLHAPMPRPISTYMSRIGFGVFEICVEVWVEAATEWKVWVEVRLEVWMDAWIQLSVVARVRVLVNSWVAGVYGFGMCG